MTSLAHSAPWRQVRHGLVGLATIGLLVAAPAAPALANVSVGGGSVSNATDLGRATNGGTAIGDASGGSGNVAFTATGCFNNNRGNCCNNRNNNRNNCCFNNRNNC